MGIKLIIYVTDKNNHNEYLCKWICHKGLIQDLILTFRFSSYLALNDNCWS